MKNSTFAMKMNRDLCLDCKPFAVSRTRKTISSFFLFNTSDPSGLGKLVNISYLLFLCIVSFDSPTLRLCPSKTLIRDLSLLKVCFLDNIL